MSAASPHGVPLSPRPLNLLNSYRLVDAIFIAPDCRAFEEGLYIQMF